MSFMNKVNVLLCDLVHMNALAKSRVSVPLNIGYISGYIKKEFGAAISVKLFKDVALCVSHMKKNKPNIIGFSFYSWNQQLNYEVVKLARKLYGDDVVVVFGGPSVDFDECARQDMISKFPLVDYFVVGDGEIGFANVIKSYLGGAGKGIIIGGVAYEYEGGVISGGVESLDLNAVESPYLLGEMDDYIQAEFIPLLQFTRGCPYSCQFCVSGADVSRVRRFSVEQAKAEIDYVCSRYMARPDITLYLAELNFGLNKQDPVIAEYIKSASSKYGYPKGVYFYNDKRFKSNSKRVLESLGGLNKDGLCFSLQSASSKVLEEVGRGNLSEEEIDSGIGWARERDIYVSTELIFGLPWEGFDSMMATVDRLLYKGFDHVLMHNLFLADGVPLSRLAERQRHGIKTKYRLLGSNYSYVDGRFVVESEEVVVSNKYFSLEDFFLVRCVNLMLFSVFQGDWYKFFFQYLRCAGVSLVAFFKMFMSPPPLSGEEDWDANYLAFVRDFKASIEAELYDDLAFLNQATKRQLIESSKSLNNGVASRLNPLFYSRLMYDSGGWAGKVLMDLSKMVLEDSSERIAEVEEVLNVSRALIIPLRNLGLDALRRQNDCSQISINYNQWRKDKFMRAFGDYKVIQDRLVLELGDDQKKKLAAFWRAHSDSPYSEFNYLLVESVFPRGDLFYKLGG